MYQIQTMASGWQKLSIRKYLFQGLKRAAEDRPMFRKRHRIGYKRDLVRDSRGEPVIRRNGRVYTVFVKDLTWTQSMEALRCELHQQGTIPDVAEALNAAGVPAPWVPRGEGERVWQWRGAYIRSIINDPLYYGEPAFMTSEPGPVWDQFIAVDPEFDPRKVHWKPPELASWTRAEAVAWRHKFLDDYVKSRHRKHHHLLLGLLLCQTCGRKLVKQGIDRTGDRYYRCPGYGVKADDSRHCPKGQFIMEKKALQSLREHALPVLFADVRALAEAAERNATTPRDESVKRKELESLNVRERNLLATVADRGYTLELKTLLGQLDRQKAKLHKELEAEEEASILSEETLRRIRSLADNPLAFYDVRTDVQQAAILRVLLADVKIRTNGQRGRAHRFLEPEWRPLVGLNSDGNRRWILAARKNHGNQ